VSGLVASYDIRQGDRVGLFYAPEPTRGSFCTYSALLIIPWLLLVSLAVQILCGESPPVWGGKEQLGLLLFCIGYVFQHVVTRTVTAKTFDSIQILFSVLHFETHKRQLQQHRHRL